MCSCNFRFSVCSKSIISIKLSTELLSLICSEPFDYDNVPCDAASYCWKIALNYENTDIDVCCNCDD